MEKEYKGLTREKVIAAAKLIDAGNEKNTSVIYDVIIEGKAYPPKSILAICQDEKGSSVEWDGYGGRRSANKYFEKLGFEIVNKKDKPVFEPSDVTILPEEVWSLILQDARITKPQDIEIMTAIYQFPEHKARASEIGRALKVGGKTPQSPINSRVSAFAKRIASFLKINFTKKSATADWYFDLFFNGYHNSNGYVWSMRPQLAAAWKKFKDSGYQQREIINYDKEMKQLTKVKKFPLNQILYGPPGTGKTYNTINKAVEIANPDFDLTSKTRLEITKEFQRLKDEKRIVFTTFHQSMSYEDFVEGIKPEVTEEEGSSDISYKIEDGIFKKLCIEATYEYYVKENDNPTFEQLFQKLSAQIQERTDSEGNVSIPAKAGGTVEVVGLSPHGNFQLVHREGNNTFTVSKKRLKDLFDEIKDYEHFIDISNIYQYFTSIIGGHNATLYWAVLNQLFLIGREDNTTQEAVTEINKKEVFEKADSLTFNHKKEDVKNYVLIIDEINRGNVSVIFGELITLLEDNKRFGKKEQLSLVLPYSKKTFRVPKNLYIIGTMNTADRSVEALDTALRRRFHFTEVPPNPSFLSTIDGYDLSLILKTINKRIEILLDRDHLIGHSYFLKVKNEADLLSAFKDRIIPLLQEYFYSDYAKIELVLGAKFCTGEKVQNQKVVFAKTATKGISEDNDFSDRVIFKFPVYTEENFDLRDAITSLLNTSA